MRSFSAESMVAFFSSSGRQAASVLCLAGFLVFLFPCLTHAKAPDDGYPGSGAVRLSLSGEGGSQGPEGGEMPAQSPPPPGASRPFPTVQTKNGFYLGFGVTRVTIGGDFDGESLQVGGGSAELMPDIDAANGLKFKAGAQAQHFMAEVSYEVSDHDGDWMGYSADSTFRSLNVDMFFIFLERSSRIRPLLGVGVGFTTLEVEDGSLFEDEYGEVWTTDATYYGVDVRLSGGLELSVTENIVLDMLGIYRYGTFYDVDGHAEGSTDDADSDGATLSLEMKFIF